MHLIDLGRVLCNSILKILIMIGCNSCCITQAGLQLSHSFNDSHSMHILLQLLLLESWSW